MGIGWLTKRAIRRIEQEEAEATESFCDSLFRFLVSGRATGSLPVSFYHALDS